MFVRLLGLKKRGSVLRNKGNLHLISLGCSAGNNGRCSSVALKRCAGWAEWPSLFRAGAAGAPGIGTEALRGHKREGGGRQRSWLLVKPTPSLLLSQGRRSLKGRWCHPQVALLRGYGQCPSAVVSTSALHREGEEGSDGAHPRGLLWRVRQEQAKPCTRCVLLLQLAGAPRKRLNSPKSYLAGTGSPP